MACYSANSRLGNWDQIFTKKEKKSLEKSGEMLNFTVRHHKHKKGIDDSKSQSPDEGNFWCQCWILVSFHCWGCLFTQERQLKSRTSEHSFLRFVLFLF